MPMPITTSLFSSVVQGSVPSDARATTVKA